MLISNRIVTVLPSLDIHSTMFPLQYIIPTCAMNAQLTAELVGNRNFHRQLQQSVHPYRTTKIRELSGRVRVRRIMLWTGALRIKARDIVMAGLNAVVCKVGF